MSSLQCVPNLQYLSRLLCILDNHFEVNFNRNSITQQATASCVCFSFDVTHAEPNQLVVVWLWSIYAVVDFTSYTEIHMRTRRNESRKLQ